MGEPAASGSAGTPAATLFVSYSGMLGGSERILLDVLASIEGGAILACPEGELAPRARELGVTVLRFAARALELRGGIRSRARAATSLAAHAREVRALTGSIAPALLVAWGMRSAIACSLALRGLPDRPRLVFEHVDLLPRGPVASAVRRAARAADRVIALSPAIAADLDPDGRLGDRLAVAEPGVDLARFAPAEPSGRREALLLGALVGWKRPELALEATAIAARELPDLRVVVAGAPLDRAGEALRERLERRASEPDLRGRVELAGALADVRPALRRAGCLLHCSDREPFGMALIEALAAGRPVVAPDAGGPREILDAKCGRLYRPGDPVAAARALGEVLGDRDRAAAMGRAARTRAQRRYGLDDALARWHRAAAGRGASGARPAPAAIAPAGAGVALVTVIHDSAPELARLLASVQRHLPGAHVVVADSGSSDGGADVARTWSGGATVVELDGNIGFGRACNAALASVDEPVAVLVNPDVELLDGSLAALGAECARPGAAPRLLAPVVLRPDGSRQDNAHPDPLSLAAGIAALIPPAALPGRLAVALAPWRSSEARRVAWAVGCCLAARTETLRRLGPFDERIFLYAEDLDLGLRADDAGVETWLWPHARVLHHGAHTSARVFGGEPIELLARARAEVMTRRRGAAGARLDAWVQRATFTDRIVLKSLAGRSTARERRQRAALREVHRRRTDRTR